MNVIQVTTTTVHPPKQGGSHRIHGLVSAFSEEGVTVDRVCQGGLATNHSTSGIQRTVEISPGYREHRSVNPFHDLASLPQVLFNVPNVAISSWLRLWPPDGLRDLLSDADLVFVEQPLQFPGIYDLAGETPVVYSSHNVETERLASLRNGPLGRRIHNSIRSIERRAVRESAGVICTSKADLETFREKFDADGPFHISPNATYGDQVVETPTTNIGSNCLSEYGVSTDGIVAAFVGSDYAPNVEAARMLLDMASTLVNREADVEILLVGEVCDSVGKTPSNVTKLGFVEDLSSLLQASDVALNPIMSGGGTNIKMLDYFAAGTPVLSTPFGTIGFEVTDGKHLLIREPSEFADGLIALENPDRRERLATAALDYVRSNHIWELVSHNLLAWSYKLVE